MGDLTKTCESLPDVEVDIPGKATEDSSDAAAPKVTQNIGHRAQAEPGAQPTGAYLAIDMETGEKRSAFMVFSEELLEVGTIACRTRKRSEPDRSIRSRHALAVSHGQSRYGPRQSSLSFHR